MIKKFFTKDMVFWLICLIILIVGKLFLPKTGKLALLNEASEVLLILMVSIFVIVKLLKIKKTTPTKKKYEDWIIIAFLIILNLFFSRNLILDIITGPQKIELYNVSTHKYQNRLEFSYYLEGEDISGNNHNLKVSIEEFNKVNSLGYGNKEKITVVYYENTHRVVDIVY